MNSSELLDALGARPDGDARWRARTPEHLQGAYGGTFGGLLAALSVATASEAVSGRTPFSLDAQFLRGLRGEEAEIRCDLLREGKSLAAVAVSILDGDALATRATVMLADVAVLDDWDLDPGHPAPPSGGKPWGHPPGQTVGIIETLKPAARRTDDGAIATTITVPWDAPDASAVAACFSADVATGPPVEAAFDGGWRPHPNPDLSLRFLPRSLSSSELVGVGRLDGVASGVAVLDLDVWCDDERIARGTATSLVSPPKR